MIVNEEMAMRTLAYLITHCKEHDETIINSEEIQAIEFLQQENARFKDKIEKVIDYANSDEFEQLFESYANFNEANCNINHFLREN